MFGSFGLLRTGLRSLGWRDAVVIALTAVLTTPLMASSSGVQIYRADSAVALEDGTLDGVSLSPRGHLQLSRQVTRLAGLEEPFVFSAVGTANGWVVGTGSEGKVLRVSADGEVETLATLPEPQVFAVAADAKGTVYAATSPDGKVYRLDDDGVTEIVDPDGVYIWDLEVDDSGHLLVATGLPAEVLKVQDTGKGQSKVEVLSEAPDVHVRSLLPVPGGLVLGTAGQGLILHLGDDGAVQTLHDAAHPEVVDLARDDDGVIYAAVLASEASQVDLSANTISVAKKETEGDAAVTVTETGADTLGSRSGGFKGGRSLVLALHPEGGHDEVAQFKDQTVHSLLVHEGELWIGTGEEGRLFRRQGFGVVEERQLEDKQVAALAAGSKGAVAVTVNGSAVYGLRSQRVEEGTYTSKVLDMEATVRFGSFGWRGDAPKGTAVELAFRSGSSTSPDATWSDWRSLNCGKGCDSAGRLREISLANLPNGRFLQWRARLEGSRAGAPRVESVELSYRQVNQRPIIEELQVLGPGEILVPSTFNAQSQAYEPWSPNRDSIFTSLQAASKSESSHLKTLWKRGYRTLQWKVKDGNGDDLAYHVHFQSAAADSDTWMPVLEDLEKPYVSFDSTVLPDGIYRFRLTASDAEERPGDEALTAQRETPPVVVDHSPPAWVEGRSVDGGFEVEVRDGLSPLRDAVFSVDAGEWTPVVAQDGLLDGRRETLRLETEGTPSILLLRLTDASHNVVTFDVLSNIKGAGR